MTQPMPIIWPNGYPTLLHKLRLNASKILGGTLLAIDPASGAESMPGYAVFEAGVLVFSGQIDVPKKKPPEDRIKFIYDKVNALLPHPADIFVIEEVHPSMSNASLQWAIGVTIAAARSPVTIQLPLNVWKALAKTDPLYRKGDIADAEMIGKSTVAYTRHLVEKK